MLCTYWSRLIFISSFFFSFVRLISSHFSKSCVCKYINGDFSSVRNALRAIPLCLILLSLLFKRCEIVLINNVVHQYIKMHEYYCRCSKHVGMASKSEKQAVRRHGKGRKCKRTLAKQDEQQKATEGPVKQEADTAPVSM